MYIKTGDGIKNIPYDKYTIRFLLDYDKSQNTNDNKAKTIVCSKIQNKIVWSLKMTNNNFILNLHSENVLKKNNKIYSTTNWNTTELFDILISYLYDSQGKRHSIICSINNEIYELNDTIDNTDYCNGKTFILFGSDKFLDILNTNQISTCLTTN